MSACKYERGDYKCPWESDETSGDGFCILHSPCPEKDQEAFEEALSAHRGERGDIFTGFVFPASFIFEDAKFTGDASFKRATFSGDALFNQATFTGNAYFDNVTFRGDAYFDNVTFRGDAYFRVAKSTGEASFYEATFAGKAVFDNATLAGKADFDNVTFAGDASFHTATFAGDAVFDLATFSGDAYFAGAVFTQNVRFKGAEFFSRTLFVPRKVKDKLIPIFPGTDTGAECDFTDVIIDPPEALVFRDVDLTRCRFQGTDLRKVEFVGVTWPAIGNRFGVCDEDEVDKRRTYPHVEQLYRQLKQNYEDRRDYERASDFHFGEKEMRRRNPKTRPGLYFLLHFYGLTSGYGERWLRPLVWMAGLLVVSTFCYLWWGLLQLKDTGPVLYWTNVCRTGLYSLKVMILLKPSNFEPAGFWGDAIYTLQSILGPLLIGLFALAVRQRLKR